MKKLSLMIAFLLIPFIAYAENSVWMMAEGTSYLGEMDTLKEVKARARQNAQSKAVEMAVGTFIKSQTLVSNSQLAERLIYATVRGKIINEEIISSDWDPIQKNLYKVKIKALVEPAYPEKGEEFIVKLHLSKTELHEGDDVQIFYKTNKDSYIYIFSIAADGSVTLLFPNLIARDNFIKSGIACQYPPANSSLHLKAMFLPKCKEASAEERLKIIATRQKEDLLLLGFHQGIFQVYDAKSTGMISDLVRRLNQMEPTDWAEASMSYTIKR
ncbi:MAG: DUF4384 domain-containing protein [Smithella sp.]